MQRTLRLPHPSEFKTPADALPLLEDLLEEMSQAQDWPVTLFMRANLILEELLLNTLTHGDTSGLTAIDVELECSDNRLTIRLTDDGAAFNPLTDAPVPDVTLPLAERPIGGLGVHLVQTISHDLEYRRADGRNHLKLVVLPES
ncbi:MAG: ATP-binding protein [Rhodospirillaceae bacterium]|nr:ATP-binding protein [Rhodospirillaceae bacterium]